MKLAALLPGLRIKAIKTDSRTIEPGDLFIAVAGLTTDGRHYIAQAIANGAIAVLAAAPYQNNVVNTVPIIVVDKLAQKLGGIVSDFYLNPSQQMNMIGITGTNGKSSTCHYIAEILRKLAGKVATIGTLGVGTTAGYAPGTHTTPDPIALQKSLAALQAQGVQTVAMEVSSQALMQERVNGLKFHTVVFTNLTQDHLDYHQSMANYWAAKLKLFLEFDFSNAIVNLDDPYGRQLLVLLPKNVNIIGYTLEAQRKAACKIISAANIQYTTNGITTTLQGDFGSKTIDIPVVGAFNLSNMLAAIATCVALGYAFEDILSVISKVTNVPGRMQCIKAKLKPLVVIDYAHTPDALASVLQALKVYCPGKLWCVFGCGGDRDRTKRSDMLTAALRFSDYVILTQDNPRTEDPNQILADTINNHTDLDNVIIEPDRKVAIQLALSKAGRQDVVLIAGKGHEQYQIIGTEQIPFSDVDIVTGIDS